MLLPNKHRREAAFDQTTKPWQLTTKKEPGWVVRKPALEDQKFKEESSRTDDDVATSF